MLHDDESIHSPIGLRNSLRPLRELHHRPGMTEHRNERQIRHLWHCWRCDCVFETVVDTKRVTTDEISRLVA